MPDFKSAMFTEIAKGVGAALQPYAKAIDLLREVSDWGPDKHGQQLTFEIVFPDKDQPNDPAILAAYAVPSNTKDIPQLLLSKNSDGFYASIGRVKRGHIQEMKRNPSESGVPSKVSYGAMVTYHSVEADTIQDPVMTFVKGYMNQHPVYQEAVQEAVDKVVSKPVPASSSPSKWDVPGAYQ